MRKQPKQLRPMQLRAIEALSTKDESLEELAAGLRLSYAAFLRHLDRSKDSLGIATRHGLVAWWWQVGRRTS